MNDPPGVQYPLGVESVQWSSTESQQLLVQVNGRWRRRRTGPSVQPVLVVESDGARRRFPALPEPRAAGSAQPGIWRMSFSVPAQLAPALGGRLSLLFGGAAIPLPVAVRTDVAGAPEPAGAPAQAPEPPGLAVVRSLPSSASGFAGGAGAAGPGPAAAGPGAGLAVGPGAAGPGAAGPRDPSGPGCRVEESAMAERRVEESAIAERLVRSAELAAERARARMAEAETEAAELMVALHQLEDEFVAREDEFVASRSEPERLRTQLAEQQRALRQAEQRVHSERALRHELEQELDELDRELDVDRLRLHRQDKELEALRRQADEAEHALAAARAAQLRAERQVRAAATAHTERDLSQELELARAMPPASPAGSGPGAPEVPVGSRGASVRLTDLERAMAAVHGPAPGFPRPAGGPGRAVAPEGAAPEGAAPAGPTPRPDSELERRLAAERAIALRTWQEIEDLRRRLQALLALHGAETPEPPAATEAAPDEPRAAPVQRPHDPAGSVVPERLSAALTRLREATPQVPEEGDATAGPTVAAPGQAVAPAGPGQAVAPAGPGQPAAPAAPVAPARAPVAPWIGAALRRLADGDPAQAGRLLVRLLPAQHLVHPDRLAYDLYLADVGCVHVTAGDGATAVLTDNLRRPRAELAFTVIGDLAGAGRLVTRGPLRRLFTRHVARVDGRRRACAPLRALAGAELSLAELEATGVTLDPALALTLVASMIDPRATAGERFTIAHRAATGAPGGAYLQVRAGDPPVVTAAPPLGPVVTSVICPPELLLAVLAGDREAATGIHGDRRPLGLLERWIARAQQPGAER
jgi:hypothetical protein